MGTGMALVTVVGAEWLRSEWRPVTTEVVRRHQWGEGAESQGVNLWGSEGGGILYKMEAQAQE